MRKRKLGYMGVNSRSHRTLILKVDPPGELKKRFSRRRARRRHVLGEGGLGSTWTTTMSTSLSNTFQPSSRNSFMILYLRADIAWFAPVPSCTASICTAPTNVPLLLKLLSYKLLQGATLRILPASQVFDYAFEYSAHIRATPISNGPLPSHLSLHLWALGLRLGALRRFGRRPHRGNSAMSLIPPPHVPCQHA